MWQNGSELTQRLLTQTQERLQKILGFSEQLLTTTCIANQDQTLLFAILPPIERARLLIELLDLGQWETKQKMAQQWLIVHKEDERERQTLEAEHAHLAVHIKEIDSTLPPLQARVAEQREALTTLRTEERHLGQKIATETATFEHDLQRHRALTQTRETLFARLSTLPTNVRTQKDLEHDIAAGCQQIRRKEEEYTTEQKDLDLITATVQDLQQKKHRGEGLLSLDTTVLSSVPCIDFPDIHHACQLLHAAHEAQRQQDAFARQISSTEGISLQDAAKALQTTLTNQQEEKRVVQHRRDTLQSSLTFWHATQIPLCPHLLLPLGLL